MAYYPLEYLKKGKIDFVYDLPSYDYKHLIEEVRKSPDRIEIINGFLSKLKENMQNFCFAIIYDIPEFEEEAYELFDIRKMTPERLNNVLNNSPLGLKLLYENFDTFLSTNPDSNYFEVVVKYAFESNNEELLHKLSRHADLHKRYLFMEYMINNHKDKINEIYDDVTKYTTSVTYEPLEQLTFMPYLMNQEDVSKLAVQLLVNKRKKDYLKLKKFILKEYKQNSLASELLKPTYNVDPVTHIVLDDPNKDIKEKEFNKDADTLFITSSDYRFPLYMRYSAQINKELLDDFYNRIRYYLEAKRDDKYYGMFTKPEEEDLWLLYRAGVGGLLEEWTEKYMDLSKNKDFGFVGAGTTCSCYRIGDYVVKFIHTKWSYEDEICPNLYLIAKNYEEKYVRDKDGIVTGGLEIQKYLTRDVKNIDPEYFRYFDLELDRLGYKRTDTLTRGTCGENTMLLDSYRDADCPNPERVPAWFKKYPIVLIDRDRIYPKENIFIKQLRNGY